MRLSESLDYKVSESFFSDEKSIAYRTLSLDTHQLLLPRNLLSQYLILLLIGFSLMKLDQQRMMRSRRSPRGQIGR
jgi:hypothetical protein